MLQYAYMRLILQYYGSSGPTGYRGTGTAFLLHNRALGTIGSSSATPIRGAQGSNATQSNGRCLPGYYPGC